MPLLQGQSETSARRKHLGDLAQQRTLVGEGKYCLQQQHDVEGTSRHGRHLRDLEPAGQVSCSLAGDLDRAGAVVDAEVVATQLASDEPTWAAYTAAQVEHADPRRHAGRPGQRQHLAGEHEALLVDELTRRIGRMTRSQQSLHKRGALVLPHAFRVLH